MKKVDRRIESLDVLRAIAILLVVGHHAAFRFELGQDDFLAALLRNVGWIGVDIFFAISGYMITMVLLRSPGDISGFFKRRAYRILPIFLIAVLVFTGASLVTGTQSELLHRIWSPALLLNGWTIPVYGAENVPFEITWSLSVEESAYILMGLACLASVRGLQLMLIVFLFIAVSTRFIAWKSGLVDLDDLYFFVLARLDAIAFGGFAAIGLTTPVVNRKWSTITFAFTTATLVFIFQWVDVGSAQMVTVGYPSFGISAALLVGSLAHGTQDQGDSWAFLNKLPKQWLVNLGQLSYFIYLFHLFVIEGLMVIFQLAGLERVPFWLGFSLAVLVTHTAARVSWKYFEYPLIRFSRESDHRYEAPAWNKGLP